MNEQHRTAGIARWHITFGLCFAVIGMGLGIYMAESRNHTQHVTHAHILLLGLVVSVVYGVVYRLWLSGASPKLAVAQTAFHQFGTVVLAIGLALLFGGKATEDTLGPVLGTGSLCVLIGALLMLYQFARAGQTAVAVTAAVASGKA